MDQPLTTGDIKRAFDGKINVYSYDELKKFKTIDEVLAPYGRAVILYFWEVDPGKRGHWTCVFKTPRNTIEMFDSFGSNQKGKQFERPLYEIPKSFRNRNDEDYPYLTRLLYESPYEIEYNEKPLQDIETSVCGRYCIARMALADMPIEKFQQIFNKKPVENDKLVVKLTE